MSSWQPGGRGRLLAWAPSGRPTGSPLLVVLQVIVGLLASLALASQPVWADTSARVAPMVLPPPPPMAPNGWQQLAKSAASQQLASDFFALERQRGAAAVGAVGAPATATATSTALASATAVARNSLVPPNLHGGTASQTPQFSSSLDGALRLDQYHSLEEIYAYLDALPRRYRQVQVFTIGRTAENRPIKALELINNATDPDFVWLDALTHAREWITGTTLLYMIDQIVAFGSGNSGQSGQQSGQTGQIRSPLYRKNYIMVPVVNPDGYAYTWSTNRMWRKNRSRARGRSPASKCVGADLNRNFDHSFGGEGSSSDPCSHIYSGPFPFSEPETRSMADLLWSLKERVKFYLTIHSFNQLWACPYAHTTEQSASLAKHMRVLRAIQRAVQEAEGVRYEIGPLSTSLYVGSGFGIDFAYDKCGIEHSYLVELRDKGAHGFVLPPDQIMPVARETLAGLQAGLKLVFGP